MTLNQMIDQQSTPIFSIELLDRVSVISVYTVCVSSSVLGKLQGSRGAIQGAVGAALLPSPYHGWFKIAAKATKESTIAEGRNVCYRY